MKKKFNQLPKLVLIVLALIVAMPAFAQSGRQGIALRFVPGLALTRGTFGDNNPKSESRVGATIGGQGWFSLSRSFYLNIEAVWQPYAIRNPHFDERFRTLYLMGGIEIATGKAYIRPSVGMAVQTWSGAWAPETGSVLAFGLAVGFEKSIGKSFHASPELILRFTQQRGLSTLLVGVQVPLGWRLGQ